MSRNIKPMTRIVCFLLIGLCVAPLIPSSFAEEPVENKSPVRGEAAWAIYDVLRKKADSIQAMRCEVAEGNWQVNAGSITPDQTKHSSEKAAMATSRKLIVWQKGVFARYEAGKSHVIRRPDGQYTYNAADDKYYTLSQGLYPREQLGIGWRMDRTRPIEILGTKMWEGKETTVIWQPLGLYAGSPEGVAVWVVTSTGVTIRAQEVWPTHYPDGRMLLRVAHSRSCTPEDAPDRLFEIPEEKINRV